MKIFYLYIFAFALITFPTSSNAVGLEISYAQYKNAENETYLEVYFALNGATLSINKNENGEFYGGIEATITFTQDDTIRALDKFRILSPSFTDSNQVSGIFFQQQSFLLKPGSYTLNINLADIKTPEKIISVSQKIRIEKPSSKATASDLLFLNTYKPATSQSKYSKSGYEIVPMVSTNHYYFPEEKDDLAFYVELYNIDKHIGEGNAYVLRYYLENYDTEKLMHKYSSFSKKDAQNIQPLLASFNISELPTGNYNLVIEALDKDQKEILKKKVFFFRQNATGELDLNNLNENLSGTFVDKITSFDSIYSFIAYLHPIASQREQKLIKHLRESRNEQRMKSFFLTFWEKQNPSDPETAWRDYYREVKIANQQYSTRIMEGYLTARGRVFLVYGKPSLVEQRKFEPGLPPYEMWQYNSINSPYTVNQNNRVFVFAEFDPSTNDYQLIHSNAYGELYNRRWQYDLAQGKYGTGSSIDQNRINSGDDFGSRLNNNIIIQSGSSSENNR